MDPTQCQDRLEMDPNDMTLYEQRFHFPLHIKGFHANIVVFENAPIKTTVPKKYAKTQTKWHVHSCAKHRSHRLVVRCCDSWGMAFPEFPNWPLFMVLIFFLNTSAFLRHSANSFSVLYSTRYGHMLVPNKCLKLVLGHFGLFRTAFLTSNMADKHTHRSFWGGSWKRQRTASNLCSSRVFLFVFTG